MIANVSSIRMLSDGKLALASNSTLHNKNGTLTSEEHEGEPPDLYISKEIMIYMFILFIVISLVFSVILDLKKQKEKQLSLDRIS